MSCEIARAKLITKKEAMELIRSAYKVPEETRQARRHRKSNVGRLASRGTREAAKAPQSRHTSTSPVTVYLAEDKQSIGELMA